MINLLVKINYQLDDMNFCTYNIPVGCYDDYNPLNARSKRQGKKKKISKPISMFSTRNVTLY